MEEYNFLPFEKIKLSSVKNSFSLKLKRQFYHFHFLKKFLPKFFNSTISLQRENNFEKLPITIKKFQYLLKNFSLLETIKLPFENLFNIDLFFCFSEINEYLKIAP